MSESGLMKDEALTFGDVEFRLTVRSTPLGVEILARSSDGEYVRSAFCEDQHEYDFEYARTAAWMEATAGTTGPGEDDDE